jgi:hypothetical protein
MHERLRRWLTRWLKWEFWPFWLFYSPVILYYLWLSLRNRSFFFFTATNPGIEFGGMLGEKKDEILKHLPREYYPASFLISAGDIKNASLAAEKAGLPCIAKPNVGERGQGVEVLATNEDVKRYARKSPVDFLIQTFIDYPLEIGVFYIRDPGSEQGNITSVVRKDFLTVTGDGVQNVRALLSQNVRAQIQIDFDHPRFAKIMDEVPGNGEKKMIEPIGNHCRGTRFRDYQQAIGPELEKAIDAIAKEIPHFYYGRFDLKCTSIDKLSALKEFAILEVNGAGAEPAHIYEPGASLWQAYRVVFRHFRAMARIARLNRKSGVPYWTFREGMKKMMDIRAYNRLLRAE